MSVLLITLLSACEKGSNITKGAKPNCTFAAQVVIRIAKDRDTSLTTKVRDISELELIQDSAEKFTCRGKGIFSDGTIAPILVTAQLRNSVWHFQSIQGSHLK